MKQKGGFVYLIEMAGFYKIGASREPEKRCRELDSSPWPAKLVHQFPSGRHYAIERTLHRRFRAQRVRARREWYSLSDVDVQNILAVGACPTVNDLPCCLTPALRVAPALPAPEVDEISDSDQMLLFWLDLPEPPPAFACPKTQVRDPGCRCWNCSVCGIRHCRNRGLFHARQLNALPSECLSVGRIANAREWATAKATLRRGKASFVRVLPPTGPSTLICTHPVSGAVACSIRDAVGVLGACLREISCQPERARHQPVTCSRDWNLSQTEQYN